MNVKLIFKQNPSYNSCWLEFGENENIAKMESLKVEKVSEIRNRRGAFMGFHFQTPPNEGHPRFKLIGLGDKGAGKTTFLSKHATETSSDQSRSCMYIQTWYDNVKTLCGEIPVVICGTKTDLDRHRLLAKDVPKLTDENLQYYEISAKSDRNFNDLFLYLARILTGKPMLRFVKSPALLDPSEVL